MLLVRAPAPTSISRFPPRRSAGPWWRRQPRAQRATTSEPRARLAFAALVAFTCVLILAPQESYPFLSPLHLAFVAALCAGAAHFSARSQARGRLLARGPEGALAIALAVWAAVTVPFSLWPSASLRLFTSVQLKSIFIFLLLGAALDTTARLRRLCWALSLCALPLAFTALSHFAGGDFIGGKGHAVDRIIGYRAGLSADPNDLAMMLNLILPVTAALLLSRPSAWKQALLWLSLLASAAAVVATFSRAGFLTLVVVALGLCSRLWRSPSGARGVRVLLWAAPLLAVVALLLLPRGYLDHLLTIGDVSSDPTGSAQDRWRDMSAALGLIAGQPLFGAGLGMDSLALASVRNGVFTSVHNIYLQHAVDLGLPGLGLFLALFWSCAAGLRRALASLSGAAEGERGELHELSAGLQLSLGAFAVASCFLPVAYSFQFFYFAGLAVAARVLALGDK